MATKFGDLFKQAKDLLSKNYPTEEGENFAVDMETKLKAEDVTVTTKVSRGADGKTYSASFAPEFKSGDLTFDGSFGTNKKNSVGGKFKRDGATVSVKANASGDAVDVVGSVDYVDEKFTVGASVTYPATGDKTTIGATGCLTAVYENVTVGLSGAADYDQSKSQLGDYNTSIGLSVDGLSNNQIGFWANKTIKKGTETVELAAIYHQKMNEKTSAAVGVKVNSNKQTSLSVGSETKLDSQSSLKARLIVAGTNYLSTGFVYSQTLNDYAKVTVGADLDTSAILAGTAGNNKFKVSINFLD
eukprot:TRINITY_DN11699_c0_g1_i1.p1 TRINITY_DN11699_c0_g1~~TRINITY_DN11699_c0_g1_i1.p1  ORF type:complete len:308 (-),score=91.50 TRINITY_DN11699_c0_g1_i1:66-968(-)